VATVRAARVADRTVREYALPAVGCIAALTVIGITDNAFDYYGPFTQYLGFLCGGAIAAAASARAETHTTAVEQPPTVLRRTPLEARFRR
jgi:hypothetical protein